MKRRCIVTFVYMLVLSSATVNAQPNMPGVQFQWALGTSGVQDTILINNFLGDRLNGMSFTSQGDIILAGAFATKRFSIGDTTLVNAGPFDLGISPQPIWVISEDAWLAKLDAMGELVWATRAGGKQHDRFDLLALNSDDEIYLTGSFEDTARFGDIELVAIPNVNNEFLAKATQEGEFLWVRAFASQDTSALYFHDMAIDQDGNLVLSGEFLGRMTIDAATLESQGPGGAFFLAMFEPDGALRWVQQSTGGRSRGESIAISSSGSVWTAGTFTESIQLGDSSLIDAGEGDIFIANFAIDGTFLTAWREGGMFEDEVPDIAVGPAGEVFLAGHWKEETTIIGDSMLTSRGEQDIFIARYASNGELQWLHQAGGMNVDDDPRIAADVYGNVLLTGRGEDTVIFSDSLMISETGDADGFLAAYNRDGKPFLAQREPDNAEHIAIGPDASVLLAGDFVDTLDYRGTLLFNPRRAAVFLAKYSSTITAVDHETQLPETVRLHPNYPNPFNPATLLSFSLPGPEPVELAIYNLLGQKVVTLINRAMPQGTHRIIWQGTDRASMPVPAGVYFLRLTTKKRLLSRKMLMLP